MLIHVVNTCGARTFHFFCNALLCTSFIYRELRVLNKMLVTYRLHSVTMFIIIKSFYSLWSIGHP